jgi:hypothetical protein
MLEEYGLHPSSIVPCQLKDSGTREMANYSVSLILNQRLVGSGTLIRVDDAYGILTAKHVALEIENSGKSIGVNIANYPHGFFIPPPCLEHVTVGDFNDSDEDEGPDLCVLCILDPNDLSTIKSKKSFYPIDRLVRGEFWNELPIAEMSWYLVGAPDERCTSEGQSGTASHVLGAKHFHGEARFKSLRNRRKFDYVTLNLIAGNYSYPTDYGGISGGGVWLLPIAMDPEIGESTIHHEAPILAGVEFYQHRLQNASRDIVCHGPISIYSRTVETLQRRVVSPTVMEYRKPQRH